MIFSTKDFDKRNQGIRFFEKDHKYFVGNKEFVSVSTLCGKFFPGFSVKNALRNTVNGKKYKSGISPWSNMSIEEIATAWRKKANAARYFGTKLHKAIELHLQHHANLNNGLEPPEEAKDDITDTVLPARKTNVCDFFPEHDAAAFRQYLQFHKDVLSISVVIATEWVIYDEDSFVAGTLDLLIYDKVTGHYILIDWKRKSSLKTKWGKSSSLIGKVPNTEEAKYQMQLSTYAYILEKRYNIPISKMYVVLMHPALKAYTVKELTPAKPEYMEAMFNWCKTNNAKIDHIYPPK